MVLENGLLVDPCQNTIAQMVEPYAFVPMVLGRNGSAGNLSDSSGSAATS